MGFNDGFWGIVYPHAKACASHAHVDKVSVPLRSIDPVSLCGFGHKLHSKLPGLDLYRILVGVDEWPEWAGGVVAARSNWYYNTKKNSWKNCGDRNRRIVWCSSTTGWTFGPRAKWWQSVEKHNSCDTPSNIYHDYSIVLKQRSNVYYVSTL